MKRTKSTAKSTPPPVSDTDEMPVGHCHCDELAPAIEELTRQVHLLGVIIDELVNEFQWQNNQIAEQIRGATDFAECSMPVSMQSSLETVRHRRITLFE